MNDTPECYVINFSGAVRLHPRHGPKGAILLVGASDEVLVATALTFSHVRNHVVPPVLVAFGEDERTGSRDGFKQALRDQTATGDQEDRFVVLRNVDQAPRDVLSAIISLLDTGFVPLAKGGLLDLRACHLLLTAPIPYQAVNHELTSRVICPAFFSSQPVPMQPAFSAA